MNWDLKVDPHLGFAWKWDRTGCLIMEVDVDAVERFHSG
jgi:metallophosphoesterase superfamily enzyme